mgnify:FL=1|jgi:serine/threonine protein kinase
MRIDAFKQLMDANPPLKVGETIEAGRYRVDQLIHDGSMSRVYKVYDTQLHKTWCLKEVINPPENSTVGTAETDALKYEYSLMATLNSPNIPRPLAPQLSEDKKRIWYILDWIDGVAASKLLKERGAIDDNTVIQWGIALARVLSYLHANNIIYRDMKPQNVMITKTQPEVHLIDFGTAHVVTETDYIQERAVGTKGYAPPEQTKKGVPYDMRWDLYALGATLFALATGFAPLKAERAAKQVGNFDINKFASSASQGLRDVVLKATSIDPEKRYQSAEEMLVDLQNIGKRDSNYRAAARRKIVLNRVLWGAAVVSLVLAGSGYAIGSSNISGQIKQRESVAQSSENYEDYKRVAELDGDNMQAYYGMLEALKKGGKVTKDQESDFLGVLMPNLNDLKKQKGYGDLAYNIGQMYFFYYGDTNDVEGQKQAASWFKDAVQSGTKNEELASGLYLVSDFQGSVQSAMRDGSDAGMYGNVYKSFLNVLKNSGGNPVIESSVYNSLMELINNYSFRLAQEGISKDSVVNTIHQAVDYASKTDSGDGTRVEELKENIRKITPGLEDKVNIAYSVRTK